MSADVIVRATQPAGQSASSDPTGGSGAQPWYTCELAHKLKDQILREDTCPWVI